MKKTAIATFYHNEGFKPVVNITYPRFKAYAAKCGADFVEIDHSQILFPAIYWSKLLIFGLFNKGYERVLWLDADIIVAKHAPNIFELFPNDTLGMLNEGKYFPDRLIQLQSYIGAMDYPSSICLRPEKYYNVGVMLIPKEKAYMLSVPNKFIGSPMPEQDHINFMSVMTHTEITDIGYKWNHITGLKEPDRRDSYFIHFTNLSATKDIELMQRYDQEI
jgi:lipopolysaccharide biosynthesis glycosyltransferase